MNTAELNAARRKHLDVALTIIDNAKDAGRDFTDSEAKQVEKAHQEVEQIDRTIDSANLMNRIGSIGGDNEPGSKTFGLFGRGAKANAKTVAAKMLDGAVTSDGRKALLSGTSIELNPGSANVSLDIGSRARLPLTFLELLPGTQQSAAQYVYMQQTVRDSNAAIVAAGATKPTSVYTAGPVQGSLRVFAHVSEPVDQYLLSDVSTLTNFLQAEMFYGLQVAVEDEVINGDGTAGHLTGLLNTSGVQTQAAGPDAITTLRAAATKIEVLGFNPGAFVLHPLDWEAIETARNASGSFDLGGPVDRAARTVWGTQVTLSTQLAQGTAVALDPQVVSVDYDSTGVKFEAGTIGDDFLKNQVRFRNEGRFGLSVFQPSGVVKVALA